MKKFFALLLSLTLLFSLATPFSVNASSQTLVWTNGFGFHCNTNGGNPRTAVTGYVEIYNGTNNSNLPIVLERIESTTAWRLLTDNIICNTCGRTDWVTYSNNNGVINGRNIQTRHPDQPPSNGYEYEWVQIWIAGAYDFTRDYNKHAIMQAQNPFNANRLWSRSNPSNSFGPPSAPNHVSEGDSHFTGIGLFVDGITFRFGYGLNDYRRIYRQPNRSIPDITLTEVTWNRHWHDEAVRAYLVNVELTDGTTVAKYYIGELYNNAYYFRSGSSGYPEPGFVFGHSIDGNFINTYVWLPPHIVRADSLRLVDITDSFFGGSTERCPNRNPGGTFRHYDDGYDVDAISVWYRRRVV